MDRPARTAALYDVRVTYFDGSYTTYQNLPGWDAAVAKAEEEAATHTPEHLFEDEPAPTCSVEIDLIPHGGGDPIRYTG
jgi:hypothetical protein